MSFLIFKNLKHLVKESTWVILGQFVTLMGSLVLVRVITSYLTPDEYGLLALSLTAVGLISQIAMNSVSASISRYLPVAIARQDLPHFTTAAKRILFASAVISLLIGVALSLFLWFNLQGDWALLCLLGFSFATISLYNFTANSVQNAARNRSIVALHTSLETWLKVLFGAAAILLLGASASSALLGYMAAVGLILLSQWFFLKYDFVNRVSLEQNNKPPSTQSAAQWQQDIWQFAWPFATWGVFTWAQQVSDLWSLKAFTSQSEVGLYTVIFQLGYAPIILLNSIVQVFLGPILNQQIEKNQQGRQSVNTQQNQTTQNKHSNSSQQNTAVLQSNLNKSKSVHRVTWVTTLLSLVTTTFAFVFILNTHEWLFSFLVAPGFRSASVYLAYMVLAGGLFSAGQILSLKLVSEFNSTIMLRVKVGTALLGLVLNIFGAWAYGTAGVVGSMIIFSVSYLAWMAWLTWREPQ
jgi:O-antigen/teichoic acid export membrane protein